MGDIENFFRTKWIWLVGAIAFFGIVWLLMRQQSANAAAAAAAAPAASAAGTVDPNVLTANAAVQTAQVQAQSAAAVAQINAAAALQSQQMQLQQQQEVDTTNAGIATTQANAAVAINAATQSAAVQQAGIQADAATKQAGIQAGIAATQANAAVAINAATQSAAVQQAIAQANGAVAIANSNNAAAVQINSATQDAATQQAKYNDAAAVAIANGQDIKDLNTVISNNQTALGLAGIQANVTNNAINAAAAVDQASLAAQQNAVDAYYTTYSNVTAQQAALQQSQLSAIANLISTGALNKGGAGGTNQVAALNTYFNPPSASAGDAASASATNVQTQAGASVLNNLISTLGKAAGVALG